MRNSIPIDQGSPPSAPFQSLTKLNVGKELTTEVQSRVRDFQLEAAKGTPYEYQLKDRQLKSSESVMGRILLARQHAFYAHREPNDDLTGRPIIAKPGTVCDVVRVDDSGRLLLSFTTHLYPKGVPGPLVKRTWYGWVAPDRVAPVPEEPASGEPSSS